MTVVSQPARVNATYPEAGSSPKLWNRRATAQCILHEITPSANLGDVKSHIHCLKSVGITSSSYGNLLSSFLMKKIPSDISLIIS